jgi:hypothetical protein
VQLSKRFLKRTTQYRPRDAYSSQQSLQSIQPFGDLGLNPAQLGNNLGRGLVDDFCLLISTQM